MYLTKLGKLVGSSLNKVRLCGRLGCEPWDLKSESHPPRFTSSGMTACIEYKSDVFERVGDMVQGIFRGVIYIPLGNGMGYSTDMTLE